MCKRFLFSLTCFVTLVFLLYFNCRQALMLSSQVDPLMNPVPIEQIEHPPLASVKVVLLVVDALGYNWVQQDPLLSMFNKYDNDSKMFMHHCNTPTLSLPNWLSIATGAPPEIHGMMGNFFISHSKFQSLFDKVPPQNGQNKAAVLGDILWSEILTLPNTTDDFTMQFTHVDNEDFDSDRHYALTSFDRIVHELTLEAIQKNYSFILSYFGDVDAQAHSYGSRKDSVEYMDSLNRTSVYIDRFLQQIDNDTVFILTADHGQVWVGGHGGGQQVVREIPFWIYQRNSNLKNLAYSQDVPQFDQEQGTSLDQSILISSLLGVAPPAESFGVLPPNTLFLSEKTTEITQSMIWKYYLYFKQQFNLYKHFMQQHGFDEERRQLVLLDLDKPGNTTDIAKYHDHVLKLRDLYGQVRENMASKSRLLNGGIGLVITVASSIWIIFTFWLLIQELILFKQKVMLEHSNNFLRRRQLFRKYKKFAIIGFVGSLLAMFLSFAVFRLLFVFIRNPKPSEWEWDFTLMNSVIDIVFCLTFLAIPAIIFFIIMMVVHHRITHKKYPIFPNISSAKSLLVPSIQPLEYFYVSLTSSLIPCLICSVSLMSGFSPLVVPIGILDQPTWTNVFRAFNLGMMLAPVLIIGGLVQLVYTIRLWKAKLD